MVRPKQDIGLCAARHKIAFFAAIAVAAGHPKGWTAEDSSNNKFFWTSEQVFLKQRLVATCGVLANILAIFHQFRARFRQCKRLRPEPEDYGRLGTWRFR
jgi:hypothetical protein